MGNNNIGVKLENYHSKDIKRNLTKIIETLIKNEVVNYSYSNKTNNINSNNIILKESEKYFNNYKFPKKYFLLIKESCFISEGAYDIIMLNNDLFIALTKNKFIIYSFFFNVSIKKCLFTKIPIENYKKSKIKFEKISNNLFYIFYFSEDEKYIFSIYNEKLLINNKPAIPIFEEKDTIKFSFCILSNNKFCILKQNNCLIIYEYENNNINQTLIISPFIQNDNNINIFNEIFKINEDLILISIISNRNYSIIYSLNEKAIKRNINHLTKYCFSIHNNKIIVCGIPNSYIISLENFQNINYQDNEHIFLINEDNLRRYYPLNKDFFYYFDIGTRNFFLVDFIMINNELIPRRNIIFHFLLNENSIKLRLFFSNLNKQNKLMCSLLINSNNSYELYDDNFTDLLNGNLISSNLHSEKKRYFKFFFSDRTNENYLIYNINLNFHFQSDILLRERNWKYYNKFESQNNLTYYFIKDKENEYFLFCDHNNIRGHKFPENIFKNNLINFSNDISIKPIQCVELENGLICAYKNKKIGFYDINNFTEVFVNNNLIGNNILKVQKFKFNLLILTQFKFMIYRRKTNSLVNFLVLKNEIKTRLNYDNYNKIQILILNTNKNIAIIIDNIDLYYVDLIKFIIIHNLKYEECILRMRYFENNICEIYSYELKRKKIIQTFNRKSSDENKPIICKYINNDKMFVGVFPNKYYIISILD